MNPFDCIGCKHYWGEICSECKPGNCFFELKKCCETCTHSKEGCSDVLNNEFCKNCDSGFTKWEGQTKTDTPNIPKPDIAPKNNEKENKPQPSLIPMDLLIEFLEPAYRIGIKKYYRESWRKGFSTTTMFDALQRHLTKFFYEGEEFDRESFDKYGIKCSHLGSALFCILSILNTLKTKPELDDRFIKKELK